MNLVDDNVSQGGVSKKVIIAIAITIVILFFIIVALLAVVLGMNKGIKFTVDGKSKESSKYLIQKDGEYYINIEDFAKLTEKNGYSYKSGNSETENSSQCYITNSGESTFFEVGSNLIYKILKEDNTIEYYYIDKPIIKENEKIYMPVSAMKVAGNVEYSNNNGNISIVTIGNKQANYDKEQSKTFVPDSSIVWDTSYANKKMLKDDLVIIKDENGKLGVGKVKYSQAKEGSKSTKVTVSTDPIVTPKYKNIKYVERFNQIIVETDAGKGIVQLDNVTTKIVPQYEDIRQINDNLYLITETKTINYGSRTDSVKKYGIVNKEGNTILAPTYDYIGVNMLNYTNNSMNDDIIIFNKYIAVCKDGLWGVVDLTGKTVIKLEYESLGCNITNASSNLLAIKDLNAIVYRKDGKYGLISFDNKNVLNNVATRMFINMSDGKRTYNMVLNGSTYNIIDYIKKQNADKNTTNTTTNTTNTTNKTNTTNTTNTTKTTNNTATNKTTTNTTNNSNTANNKTNTTNTNTTSKKVVVTNTTR